MQLQFLDLFNFPLPVMLENENHPILRVKESFKRREEVRLKSSTCTRLVELTRSMEGMTKFNFKCTTCSKNYYVKQKVVLFSISCPK